MTHANEVSSEERRWLDMLAGWSMYLRKCAESEEPHPGVTKAEYEQEADDVDRLYQYVGGLPGFTATTYRECTHWLANLLGDGPPPADWVTPGQSTPEGGDRG